ncbi:MAG: ligand-binding SRPBCC domain-containing protein [Candidatus Promineifilaceae bacterium]|jgi:ligand-binding SRPBCC domain-containing protein
MITTQNDVVEQYLSIWKGNKGDYVLEAGVWLPRPREDVFAFFADAQNLQQLTPNTVQFRILTPLPLEMRTGARIDYALTMHGVPFKWKTEITRWKAPAQFEDTQRKGPYRKWVHLHTFEEVRGGTMCRDRVCYRPPGGALVNRLFVQSNVETIFKYRADRMLELFGCA